MSHSANPGEAGRPRVIVVGTGFGGLAMARGLAKSPLDVLVMDRENYHAFLLEVEVADQGSKRTQVRGVTRRNLPVFHPLCHQCATQCVTWADPFPRTPR